MKAFITGDRGFLGRHFSAALTAHGWDVYGCDVRTTAAVVMPEDDAFWHFNHNVGRYDLVVNCAAVEPHRAAIDGNPMHLAQNLQLDSAMFDWAVRTRQQRVLYISSSAAYPVRGFQDSQRLVNRPLAERYIDLPSGYPDPDSGYGWLKLTGERLAADAARAGLPVHVVRPFSGYGEDQGENWPFGAFIARAKRREDPFVIWGDGTQVRDWIHVSDLVAGALAVVEQDVREPVNLCTGIGTSMAELVQLVCKTAGYGPDVELRADKPAGVAYRVGDPTRLHQIYTPKVSLAEGVERALA